MTAIDRAEKDIERGDYGFARQRLMAYLTSKGYDQQIVARIAQLSYEMHDSYEAGRFWLTANAEGEHVDHAITCFLKRAGKDPRQVVSRIPRAARLKSLDGYPEVVRARLRRLGLDDAIVQAASATPVWPARPWRDRAIGIVCIVVLLFVVVLLVAGLWQIGSWILGRG